MSTTRSKLEQVLEYLVNNESDKAQELLHDVIVEKARKIHEELIKILKRENRIELYNECLNFLKTRVNLDLALFKDDIWAH